VPVLRWRGEATPPTSSVNVRCKGLVARRTQRRAVCLWVRHLPSSFEGVRVRQFVFRLQSPIDAAFSEIKFIDF
jgi:hypothetical protein